MKKKPALVLVTSDQESNAQLSKLGVDLLEVRVDFLKDKSLDAAVRLLKERRKLRLPLIVTVRSDKNEGAKAAMSVHKKWALLQTLVPLADWVDIELSSPICKQVVVLAHACKRKAVISAHDFKRTPSRAVLTQFLKKALASGADMVKFAAMTKSPDDLLTLMEFTDQNSKHPLVIMGMGPWGGLSRLILPSLGSRWVYTFSGKSTVPGQLSLPELKNFFKIP
jgi:3-dehydroquinate dehydratase I